MKHTNEWKPLTERDDLIKIILTDNVTYDEAYRIAGLIIDEGWASPTTLHAAKEAGFVEASKIMVDMHDQFRKDNLDLLEEDFDQEKLQAVEKDLRVGGVTSYSDLQAYLASKWHGLMVDMVKDMLVPAKLLDKRRRKA